MMDEDTELLLGSLASLVYPRVFQDDVLLNALVDCNGDIDMASILLQSKSTTRKVPSKKRKQPPRDLHDWMISSSASPSKKPASEGQMNVIPATHDSNNRTSSSSSITSSAQNLPSTSKTILGSTPKDSPQKMKSAFDILRASPDKPKMSRNPPLTLSNPAMVAQHVPCTLHYSVLPPKLACELFYTLVDAAKDWSRNKWWLFERLVESPHKTSFFARAYALDAEGKESAWEDAAQYWYNGRKTSAPLPFPEEMERACQYIEKIVNDELRKRARYALEYGGETGPDSLMWRANVAAANCYEGMKEGVGYHSDQLTHLGPYPTIASLSLGTTRTFRLREVVPISEADTRHSRTYNIPLPHNSLIIMHASTQERFKHSIPPQAALDLFRPPYPRRNNHTCIPSSSTSISGASSKSDEPFLPATALLSSSLAPAPEPEPTNEISASNCRINVTFRFYRPDFLPASIPRCKCDVPCILRPDMKRRVDKPQKADLNLSSSTKGSGSADVEVVRLSTGHSSLSPLAESTVGLKERREVESVDVHGGGSTAGTVNSAEKDDQPAMLDSTDRYKIRYWWTCHAGAQNEGKGCGMWKIMDVQAEGRGPFLGDPEKALLQ